MSRARLLKLNRLRVRKCREREENGLGCIEFAFDLEALVYLLNHAVPQAGRPFTSDDRKALAQGVIRLLERLLQETQETHYGLGGNGVV